MSLPACSEDVDRVKRPFKYAGVCSRLFFLWATPLFKKGNSTPLKVDDLWWLRDSETAASASGRLSAAWQDEQRRAGSRASLVKAVIRTWLPHYVWPITLSAVYLALGCLSSSVFMRSLIKWYV